MVEGVPPFWRETVQVPRHGGRPGRFDGLAVALELLDFLTAASYGLEFPLCRPAGPFELCEGLVKLLFAHAPLRSQLEVAAPLLVHFGETLEPRFGFALRVPAQLSALLFYEHVHAGEYPIGVLQHPGHELPHGLLSLLGSLHLLPAGVAPVVHAAVASVIVIDLLAARGGV